MSNLQPSILSKLFLVVLSFFTTSQSIASDYVYSAGTGVVFAWEVKDEVGTYSQKGSRLFSEVAQVDADAHRAIATFNGWSLRSNTMYYAYAPYNTDYYMNSLPITDLPVTYLGQQQTGNGTLSHLQPFDYMMAQYTTGETTADISLRHLGSILRVEWRMPSRQTLAALTLSADAGLLTAQASMNLPAQSLTPTQQVQSLTLRLADITVEEGEAFVAYMMLSPANLEGKTLTLRLTSADGTEHAARVIGANILEGKTYPLAVNTTPPAASPDVPPAADNPPAASLPSALDAPSVTATDFPVDTENTLKIDETAGITRHSAPPAAVSRATRLFNLAGQQLSTPQPNRIYIRNGKKTTYSPTN